MSREKTPWFPASIKPVRDGWYETRIGIHIRMRRFFDGQWYVRSYASDSMGVSVFGRGCHTQDEWRGFTECQEL